MKLSLNLRFAGLFLAIAALFSSCTDDGTGTAGPTVDLGVGANYVTGDVEVVPGAVIQVNIKASKGDSDLKVLTIKEDGSNVSLDRITIGGVAANANPTLLFGGDKTSFDYVVGVLVHGTLDAKTYSFEVQDENGSVATRSFKVTVAGTPVTALTGVLLNQAGPTGTGGLNLLTGVGTGSMDPTAHIKDEGIDIGAPSNATNWIQKISGANGSELKYIVKGQNGVSESFTYAGIAIQEEILDLWGKGTAFTVSNVIKVGDIIIVKNGTKYFLLEVKEVNITTNDNADNYKFDIKY